MTAPRELARRIFFLWFLYMLVRFPPQLPHKVGCTCLLAPCGKMHLHEDTAGIFWNGQIFLKWQHFKPNGVNVAWNCSSRDDFTWDTTATQGSWSAGDTLLVKDNNREWIFFPFFFPEGEKDYLLLLPATHLCVETLDNSPVTPRGVVVVGESARTTHTLRESCGLLRLSRLQRLEQPQTCHQLPSPPSPQSTTAG